jgi:dolichyl-phosphate-mannose-protein mannosyltransferase
MFSPRQQKLLGLALAICATMLVLANEQQIGVARDEVVYMQAGAGYAKWWLGLVTFDHGISKDSITRSWGGPDATSNNREHPPFMKTLYGFSDRILHRGLGMNEVIAFRFPAAILHGILVFLVFLMVLELWGLAEAIVSALLLLFLPRALFHAGLACFDAPIMALWFATVYCYWRCLDGRRWPWTVGVVFGLALATKHNAVLLPIGLGLHYLITMLRTGGVRGLLSRWRVVVSLAVLGPLTLIVLWPWLWLDPVGHIKQWLEFHLTHTHYNYEYLGHNWNAPRFPWHVALVTTLFTVPVVTLVAAALGSGVWIARRKTIDNARAPGLLLALSAVASIGPFFLGTTPIFGAEKHWMPALPSICIAAGVGTAWCARGLAAMVHRHRMPILAATCTVVVVAAVVETVVAQPYALTWYNALAGGAPGGADRGMNRQFWGVSALGVLPILEKEAPSTGQAPVYSHDASPAWGLYQNLGLLPKSMPDAGHEDFGISRSQYAIVVHELHFNRHDYLIWKSYGTVQPFYVLRSHGVPIVTVYRRPPK